MSFQLVDRVYDCEVGKSIFGLKNVTRSEPYFYTLPGGDRILSTAILAESGLQLGSWLCAATTNFEKLPILIGIERADFYSEARAGDQLHIRCNLENADDDVVELSGTIHCQGRLISSTSGVRAYLVPSDELFDPVELKRRWQRLNRPYIDSATTNNFQRLDSNSYTPYRPNLMLVDSLPRRSGACVKTSVNFSQTDPFVIEHFPRRPLVPGMIMLACLGESAQFLLRGDRSALIPRFIEGARFRSFVVPGDSCAVQVAEQAERDGTRVIQGSLSCAEKRVAQAYLGFERS